MPTATAVASPALLRDLYAFLSLEAPFLISKLPEEAPPHELEELLAARLADRTEPYPRFSAEEIHPGLTQASAAGAARQELQVLLRGFFRRQEIKASLDPTERLLMYRTMLLTRELDDFLKGAFDRKEIRWRDHPSPQKGFRSTGQEAIVGAGLRLRRPPEHEPGPEYRGDLIAPLIRDLGVTLMFMPDPQHPILVQYGKKGTPVAGRDLHVGNLEWGVLPPAAPLAIATQTVVGNAYGFKLKGEDRVAVSFIGDGGCSLGEWHEAVNFAAAQRLAVLFVVQNNQWALGTHVSEQTAARRFAAKGVGYGVPGVTVFGNDPDEIAAAVAWGAERARAGEGPALIELVTYRRPGHAHHDDDRFHGNPEAKIPGYEIPEERLRWEALDPVELYELRMLELGLLSGREVVALRQEVTEEVQEAARAAAAAPWPGPEDYRQRVYASRSDPAPEASPAEEVRTRTMAYDEAVRQGMVELMEEDPGVFILGEDVGGRYGGAFGVTRGLAKRFGAERCVNTPLAESAIVGCAVGAALEGMRPIVEMQFADFLATGFNALVNNAAKLYWRWGRPVPIVVRLPYGGATGTLEKLLGGGPFHSQCPEMWFVRTPGWKIVAPATPADAKGLMLAAVRDPNPVLYLEAKGLYGFFRTDLREEVPLGSAHEVPIGVAAVQRQGDDLTLVTYGAMVWTALAAAEQLAAEGIEAEVVDLRSLWPLDLETVAASVRKTHRVLLLHEDTRRGGFAGELSAILADELFYWLDAPIRRIGAPDTPVPYSPPLEHDYLPKAEEVVVAAKALMAE